jgi:hypothetical protein
MERGFRVFYPYRHTRKISIFGSARLSPEQPEYEMAQTFAQKIAQRGFMVITGAGPGSWKRAMPEPDRSNPLGSIFNCLLSRVLTPLSRETQTD